MRNIIYRCESSNLSQSRQFMKHFFAIHSQNITHNKKVITIYYSVLYNNKVILPNFQTKQRSKLLNIIFCLNNGAIQYENLIKREGI